jgi:hypothetical protein
LTAAMIQIRRSSNKVIRSRAVRLVVADNNSCSSKEAGVLNSRAVVEGDFLAVAFLSKRLLLLFVMFGDWVHKLGWAWEEAFCWDVCCASIVTLEEPLYAYYVIIHQRSHRVAQALSPALSSKSSITVPNIHFVEAQRTTQLLTRHQIALKMKELYPQSHSSSMLEGQIFAAGLNEWKTCLSLI